MSLMLSLCFRQNDAIQDAPHVDSTHRGGNHNLVHQILDNGLTGRNSDGIEHRTAMHKQLERDEHMSFTPAGSEHGKPESVMDTMEHQALPTHDHADTYAPSFIGKAVTKHPHDDDSAFVVSTISWNQYSFCYAFDMLLAIAEWDYETKRIWKLAVPYVVQAFLQGTTEIVKVSLIGNFVGTNAVTAYVTIDLFVGVTSGFFKGIPEALGLLGPQSVGNKNYKLTGQYLQLCLVSYLVCSIPILVVWVFIVDELLVWLGFNDETIHLGRHFTKVFVVRELFNGIDFTIHSLLDVIDLEVYSMIIAIVKQLVATGSIAITVIWIRPELMAAGYVDAAVSIIFLFINIGIVYRKRWFRKYYGGLVRSNAFRVSNCAESVSDVCFSH
jgi:MatE